MSTQKECLVCKRKIGVASKTCALCGAKQPYKQRLENTKRKLSHGWKERQKKYSSVSKVYDATDLLIHKWELLERHPMLLLARRTSYGFSAECFCPWQISCEGGEEAISTIQRIYESLLNVALTSGQRPPPDTVEPPLPRPLPPPPPAAAITTDPGSVSMSPTLLRPQLSSDSTSFVSPVTSSSSSSSSSPLTRPVSSSSSRLTPPVPSPLVSPPSPTTLSSLAPSPAPSDSSDSPTRTRTHERWRRDPTECPVHQRSTSFPYRTILGERITEGQAEVLVQWYPCSGCGERWKNTWEPKENLLTSSP